MHQNIGLDELQNAMLEQLFGNPATINIVNIPTGRNVEGYLADVYDSGMVINKDTQPNGDIQVDVWISQQSLARLLSNSLGRIEVK